MVFAPSLLQLGYIQHIYNTEQDVLRINSGIKMKRKERQRAIIGSYYVVLM